MSEETTGKEFYGTVYGPGGWISGPVDNNIYVYLVLREWQDYDESSTSVVGIYASMLDAKDAVFKDRNSIAEEQAKRVGLTIGLIPQWPESITTEGNVTSIEWACDYDHEIQRLPVQSPTQSVDEDVSK